MQLRCRFAQCTQFALGVPDEGQRRAILRQLEWAAREGWNPGLDDAECFYATVPDVLLMGYMGREPIAVISAFPAGYHALRGTVPGNGLSNDSQPMSYTIGTAAKATGKAKSTISRDVKSGRISAERQPDGSYLIDPSELHRVYPTLRGVRVEYDWSGPIDCLPAARACGFPLKWCAIRRSSRLTRHASESSSSPPDAAFW